MALTRPIRLRVDDPSGVAPARRAAERLAADLGFDEEARGKVAIVVTELTTNLLRHAGNGEVIVRASTGAEQSVDVVAWDTGPGIPNLGRARGDGFSTAGGSGTGLGAVERLSAAVDLQAAADQGVVIVARLGDARPDPDVDGLALAMDGETACGDAWTQVRDGDVVTILLADGLGHGDDAAAAANAAVREMRAGHRARGPPAAHPRRAAAHARGGGGDRPAGCPRWIARVRRDREHLGDDRRRPDDSKSLPSMAGTLGHRVQRWRTFHQQLPPGALLVLHSDGCRTGWNLSHYPGAQRRDPLVIASLLVRDFERGRDDVSVVVARTTGAAR